MSEHNQNQSILTWQRQVAPLVNCAQVAEEMLGKIEGPLGAIYQQAEQAGDQQTVQHVMTVWDLSQHLAAQIPPFVAALQGGAATIEEIKQQRDAITSELNDLVAAIDDYDLDDPRLRDFAEVIQDDAYEWASKQAMEHASMVMYDEVYDSLYEEIVEAWHTTHMNAIYVINLLRGDAEEITDERRDLLKRLLATFDVKVGES